MTRYSRSQRVHRSQVLRILQEWKSENLMGQRIIVAASSKQTKRTQASQSTQINQEVLKAHVGRARNRAKSFVVDQDWESNSTMVEKHSGHTGYIIFAD